MSTKITKIGANGQAHGMATSMLAGVASWRSKQHNLVESNQIKSNEGVECRTALKSCLDWSGGRVCSGACIYVHLVAVVIGGIKGP